MNINGPIGTLALVCALATASFADDTPILTDANPAGEADLIGAGGILDTIYGLENLTRLDDSPDQLWQLSDGPQGSATILARYAGYGQDLGIIDDNGFQLIDSSLGSNPNTIFSSPTPVNFTPVGDTFQIANDPSDAPLWSSLQSANPGGGRDHMVTWQLNGADDVWVFVWEDLNLGDQDYNDPVTVISGIRPVPEPGTLLLLGTGVIGLAAVARRRRTSASR